MGMKRLCRFFAVLCGGVVLLSSCITEEVADNTASGNFDALWTTLDQHYCFFEEKKEAYGLNWQAVREEYRAAVVPGITTRQLFEVMGTMLAELRDGHVNLYSDFDLSRYDKWYTDSAANFNAGVIRDHYIQDGRLRTAGGLQYGLIKGHDIGYVYYGSFSSGFSSTNMYNVLKASEHCKALIIDVRDNGGGSLSYSELLASFFFQADTHTGYMRYKSGPGHNDFAEPTKVTTPAHGSIYWERPVAVLTNRYSYSATNDFVNRMNCAPMAFTVGTWTGGGGGMPLSSELPNGWMVRFSACPMYTVDMQDTESGLPPDLYACTTPEEEDAGIDAVLERAIEAIEGMGN